MINSWTPGPLLLLTMTLGRVSPQLSPYRVFNYTWLIINQAGDIANSTSKVTAQIPWIPLEVDLCKLALGAHPDWGVPSHYLPQAAPPNTDDRTRGQNPACLNAVTRSWLQYASIYVCPGATHRDRSLGDKCGYDESYFCATWGCETTGDTYWKPSSSWDLITVKRKNPPPGELDSGPKPFNKKCQNWCNTIVISFTAPGKNYDWQHSRGAEWGLRLYKSGEDIGLTFTIKLTKNIPNIHRASIGPNPQLHDLAPPPPKEASKPKSLSATRAPGKAQSITLFQPTIPPGPMPSSKLILSLLNASASALLLKEQELNSTRYTECWMCFSAAPPFYEGIALFGNFTYTNDSKELIGTPLEITLTEVSGVGSCIIGKSMIPPRQLLEICNHTVTIDEHSDYLLAPNYTHLACSTGLTTFLVTSQFISKRDYCVLIQLVPKFSIHQPEDLLNFWERGSETPRRAKREPISAITLAVILGLGAAGTGTGVASLITSQQNRQQYYLLSAAIDKDLAELRDGLANLKDSVASLSEVVLQNRRGLDLLLLKEGGLCAALREECCVYVDKTGLVDDSLRRVKESLEKRNREREQQESWYKNWFSTSPWLSTLLPSILGPFIGLLLLISFGPWAFQRLTRFVKSQIDSTLPKNFISVQYHRLDTAEAAGPGSQDGYAETTAVPATERLDFNKLL